MAVTIPHIGEMRQSGQLQSNNPTQQGAGKKDSYVTVLTCRGRLQKINGNRYFDQAETTINSSWEWICRFQNAINSVSNKKSMRWVIDGRMFSVNNYELIDQKRRYYRFVLLENE